MGNPKQKWTPEEELALRAGIDKHGAGKWRTIQKDPEFSIVLATRSNVDLKDKWRNMNVGIIGPSSREKQPKAFKLGLPRVPDDGASLSGDASGEESRSNSDMLITSDSTHDKKCLDNRYTDIIINSIIDMNEYNGCSTTEIASFVEAHHPVPSNFRRLLSSKLRDMVSQGNLLKIKQNYRVNPLDPKGALVQMRCDRKGLTKSDNLDFTKRKLMHEPHSLETLRKKGRYDIGYTKLASQEAARAAAVAIAEAEAAAAAAESAAKEAEDAEAEAEAAMIVMELAALAAQDSRKGSSAMGASLRIEDIVIVV